MAGAAHAGAEAAAHALFKAQLAGDAGFVNALEHGGGAAGKEVVAAALAQGIGDKALHAKASVVGGDHHLYAQLFELFDIERNIFRGKAQDSCHILAHRLEAAGGVVHGGHTHAAADDGGLAAMGSRHIKAVAKAHQHVQHFAGLHGGHFRGALAHHLIDDGDAAFFIVTYADGAAQIQALDGNIDELAGIGHVVDQSVGKYVHGPFSRSQYFNFRILWSKKG